MRVADHDEYSRMRCTDALRTIVAAERSNNLDMIDWDKLERLVGPIKS